MNMNIKQAQGSPILSFLLGAGGLVLLVFGLRNGANLLNPFILALVFAFTLSPALGWLQRKGVPTWLALTLMILAVFFGVLALITFVAVALDELIVTLPTYQSSAEEQQIDIQSWLADQGINARSVLDSFSIQKVFELLAGIVVAVAETISGAFLMMFILAFMLFESIGLSKKMKGIPTITDHSFVRTFAKFGGELRSYVLVLTWINFLVGAGDAIFLAILGVNFPILWGILAWFMGYIPSVGFWLALIPPFLLAFAQFGLGKAALVLVGYILINGSVQNLVQPKLMGDRLDLSPLVVVASLFIWTWVLGPVGALIAVPMTMAVQKLILEPYNGSRWLAELMGARAPVILVEDETEADLA